MPIQNDLHTVQAEEQTLQSGRSFWAAWTGSLRQWGLDGIAATLLEASGPLNVLLAQFMYLGQPFLSQSPSGGQIQAIARLLEEPGEAQAFASFLREEEPR